MDKLEPLWSESPAAQTSYVARASRYSLLNFSQEEAASLLLQHPEVRQPPGAAGVPVSHHTGQNRPGLAVRRRCVSFFALLTFFPHCRHPAVRGELPQPPPDAGQSQGGQQGRPRLLQAVLQGRSGLCQTGERSEAIVISGAPSVGWKCVTHGSFHLLQSPPELLKDSLCPAVLMPSKACELKLRFDELLNRSRSVLNEILSFLRPSSLSPSLLPCAVTRRCLPALGTMKGGVVVVGNETSFDDGHGVSVNATDVLEASK